VTLDLNACRRRRESRSSVCTLPERPTSLRGCGEPRGQRPSDGVHRVRASRGRTPETATLRTGLSLVASGCGVRWQRRGSTPPARTLPERSASLHRVAGSPGGSAPAMGCTACGVMRDDLGRGTLERGTRAPTGSGQGHLRVFETTERALGPMPSRFPRGPRRETAHADHGAVVRGSFGIRKARPGVARRPLPRGRKLLSVVGGDTGAQGGDPSRDTFCLERSASCDIWFGERTTAKERRLPLVMARDGHLAKQPFRRLDSETT